MSPGRVFPGVQRRRYLACTAVALAALAGCAGGSPSTDDPGTAVQVTTSSAEGLEFHVSQIAIPADATGPNAYYRVENTADADRTVRIETVLEIPDGGSYRSFAVVTVPAGDEVIVSYRIVAFEELTEAESRQVRAGDVGVVVLVNGEERRDI